MSEDRKSPEELAALFEQQCRAMRLPALSASELLDLMDYYSRQGRDFESEVCRHMAERLEPDNDEVLLTRAHYYADDGDWASALALRKRLAIGGYEDRLFQVEYIIRTGAPDQALQRVMSALPSVQSLPDYDFLYDAAILLRDYGYPAHALRLIGHVPPSYIDYAAVCDLRAECAMLTADYNAATAILNAAIDQSPFDGNLWTRMASTAYRQGKYTEAQEAAEYALATGKNDEAARLKCLADIALCADDEAMMDLLKAADSMQDAGICLSCGHRLYQAGRYTLAEMAYRQAAVYSPRDGSVRGEAIGWLALCLVHNGACDSALVQLASLRAMGYDNWSNAQEMAEILFAQGYEKYAVRALLEGRREKVLSDARYFMLIRQLGANGCYEAARPLWQDILAQPLNCPQDLQAYVDQARTRLA